MPNNETDFTGLTAIDFIGPTSGTVNEEVTFLAYINGADSCFWEFDNSIYTVENPTHTFLEVGSYSVKLTGLKNNTIAGTVIKENFITIE